MNIDNLMWIAFGVGMILQTLSLRIVEKDVKELKRKIYGK